MIYSAFKTIFTTLLGRRDLVQATIGTYYELALLDINRDLTADWLEVDAALVADANGAITPPTGYKRLLSLYNGTTEYRYKRPGEFIRYDSAAGDPLFYTRRAGRWFFVPALASGAVINLTYITKNVLPVNDAAETPLLLNAPDIPLFGALYYACLAFKDDRVEAFRTMFTEVIATTVLHESEKSMSEGPVATEPSTDNEY